MFFELLKNMSTQSLATNIWVILTNIVLIFPQSKDDVTLMRLDTSFSTVCTPNNCYIKIQMVINNLGFNPVIVFLTQNSL